MIYQPLTEIDLAANYPTLDILAAFEKSLPDSDATRALLDFAQSRIASEARQRDRDTTLRAHPAYCWRGGWVRQAGSVDLGYWLSDEDFDYWPEHDTEKTLAWPTARIDTDWTYTEPVTPVLFRVWTAEFPGTRKPGTGDLYNVIALFPANAEYRPGSVSSYMHIGQHGAADLYGIIWKSRPATPEEYAPLKRELERNYGYNLKVYQRADRRMIEHYKDGNRFE